MIIEDGVPRIKPLFCHIQSLAVGHLVVDVCGEPFLGEVGLQPRVLLRHHRNPLSPLGRVPNDGLKNNRTIDSKSWGTAGTRLVPLMARWAASSSLFSACRLARFFFDCLAALATIF